jgi:hypothetical protein
MPDQATTKHAYRKPVHEEAYHLGVDIPGLDLSGEAFAEKVLANPANRFADGDLLLVVETRQNAEPTVWAFKVEVPPATPRLVNEYGH